MRYTRAARPQFILPTALILAVLAVAAAVVAAGPARPALAVHGGTFGWETDAVTVDEGDQLVVNLIVLNRDPTVNLNIGFNVAAVQGTDVPSDFCRTLQGAVGTFYPVSIPIPTDADSVNEIFTVTINFNNVGMSPPCASGEATPGGVQVLTVTVNDTGGDEDTTFRFASASSQFDDDEGSVNVAVTRSGDTSGTDTVECVVSGGTATGGGVDYTFSPTVKVLTFNPGITSRNCSITLVENNDVPAETVILSLQDPSAGATIGSPDDHTLTIVDSGAEVIQFSQPGYTVDEDGGTASFTVTRTNPSGDDTVVCRTVEQAGEADEDVDYQETDDVLNFTGSVTTRTCTVPIIDDEFLEGDETFRLILEITSGNAVLGPNDDVIVTIAEDDAGPNVYTFQSATYNVQESAGSVTLTVVRSTNVGTGSVSWDITGGSATAGSDYIDASGTVNFTAGQTQQTFAITILSTVAVEANETILVSLLNPVNGTLGNPSQATVTITEIGLPTVTNVDPDNIPTAGGTSVVITGTNFTGATAVTFGAVNATSFVVNNSTQITAVAPARQAGTYDVRVTTPAGTSANTVADDITYGAAESITYQLSARWSLIAWLGKNNASIPAALQGNVALTAGLPQVAPNNIFNTVTAVATWNNAQQRYLFWFPTGSGVPGANDITTFQYGTPYWIAVTTNINWTVVEGP